MSFSLGLLRREEQLIPSTTPAESSNYFVRHSGVDVVGCREDVIRKIVEDLIKILARGRNRSSEIPDSSINEDLARCMQNMGFSSNEAGDSN